MGILTALLTLPVSGPARGTLWIAGQIRDAVNHELNDPAALRAALDALEEKLLAGEITEEAYEAAETDLLTRLQATGP